MNHFNKLPLEIAAKIITHVPAESVLACKLVCKSLKNAVTNDRTFKKMHLDHSSAAAKDCCKLGFLAFTANDRFYYFDYNDDQNHELTEPIERIRRMITTPTKGTCFVGSCNGLICLVQEKECRPVCICNPFTKEYVQLPEIRIDGDDFHFCSFGFGYLPSTNEYKVVAIHKLKTEFIEVHIYTLGSGNGWRNLGKFNSEFFPMYNEDNENGRFADGSVYWPGANLDRVLTFDLIEETFCKHLDPPPFPPGTDLIDHIIGVLDGFLYISISDKAETGFDVWLLKKKHDNQDKMEGEEHQSLGWSKEFRVDDRHSLAITKRGDVLTYSNFDYDLNIYNPKESTSKRLVDFKAWICRVFPHQNTLVSLKELGEEDMEMVKSVEAGRNPLFAFQTATGGCEP